MIYNICEHIKNKYLDELSTYSPYIRQAMAFQHFVEEIPLSIKDLDKIAGWYGYEEADAPEILQGRDFPYRSVLDDSQNQLREALYLDAKTVIYFNPSHTCIDYGLIIENGLEHYVNFVNKALAEAPENACLQAMKISLQAACRYAERFSLVAQEAAQHAQSAAQKEQFLRIHSALCRVPRFGARDFLEAVQSVWLMHSLIPMAEMNWASISIGRIDQYLYPFYQKHLAEGGSTEEVKAILKNLFTLLDSYGDGACAMNIGGMDGDGNDMMNDLSKLLIEVEKEMSLRAPIFAVRVTPNMPEEIFDSLIDFNLFKIGQPTFYGELPCRQALLDRGVCETDVVNFSANSCMGLVVTGREFADMWGIKFNSHIPLEFALNKGKPINGDADFALTTPVREISDFDRLMEQYGHYFAEMIGICAKLYESVALEQEMNYPDPLLSALTDGCIQNRRDRATGAAYNTVTVETMGLVNTCDALSAINELVFKQKKYTLDELVAAAKSNYEGFENVYLDISKCPKYGSNDSDVNGICKRLCEMVSAACKNVCHENRWFLPSLHTIDANIGYGEWLYATLDGRKAGQPVNRNANPSFLLQKTEHTSVILSATAFEQAQFSGGQPIDLYFDRSWFDTKESKDKIKALIRTYFHLGGLQLQVNSVDIELLEKAHKAPDEYPFVIVRKGGYSVRFNEMAESTRVEFIDFAKKMERGI